MSQIRPALPDDAEVLFDIHLRAVAEGGRHHYPQEILDVWNRGRSASGLSEVIADGGCFVLVEEGQILGFVHLQDPEMVGLFVDPAFHGRGYGSKLFHFGAEQITSRPMTLDATLNAVDFYRNRGCIAGRMKCVRRSDRDIYVRHMELR